MTLSRRRIIAAAAALLGVFALVAAYAVWRVASLDGPWLKAKLEDLARQKGAQLSIGSCDFRPFSGRARLGGTKLHHESAGKDGGTSQTTRVDVSLKSGSIEVRLWPLLSRRLEINSLELVDPQVSVHLVRNEETATTTAKLRTRQRIAGAIADGAWEAFIANPLRKPRQDISARKRWFRTGEGFVFLASRVGAVSGTFEYTLERPDSLPFCARANVKNYLAVNVALDSPYELANRADYEAELDLRGVPAQVKRHAFAEPSVWTITGADLGYLDRLFDQTDALRYEAGTLSFSSQTFSDSKLGASKWEIGLRNLRLGRDPAADVQTELLVPVEKLIAIANARGGNLSFSARAGQELEIGSDLDVLSLEIIKGIYGELAKEKAPDSKSAGEALEKVLQRFDRKVTTGSVQKAIRVLKR